MPDGLQATRSGLHMALAYTLPLVVWLLGQSWLAISEQADPAAALQQLLHVLILLQACALALCTPWLLRYPKPICGVAMLLLAPLPLYSIAWVTGTVEARTLLLILFFLGALALCLYGFYRVCVTLIPGGQPRSLAVLGSQLALPMLCWVYRGDCLRMLGL